MKHVPHYDFAACPMTDEDLAITRAIASRLNGAYFAINLSESEQSARRDFWVFKHAAKTTAGIYSFRRDCNGRLVPPARCLADFAPAYTA